MSAKGFAHFVVLTVFVLVFVILLVGTFSVDILDLKNGDIVQRQLNNSSKIQFTTKEFSYKPIKTYDIVETYEAKILELLGYIPTELECLFENESYKISQIRVIPEDGTLLDGLAKIENYEFKNRNSENNKKLAMGIAYTSICKSGLEYFVLFDTTEKPQSLFVSTVNAAGGWSPPTNLSYFNDTDFIIFEDLSYSYPAELIVNNPNKTRNIAYFGCRRIIGVNSDKVVLSCGGGDGCCGGSSLYEVNLKSQVIVEKATCYRGLEEKSCYNDKGVMYFNQPNNYQ